MKAEQRAVREIPWTAKCWISGTTLAATPQHVSFAHWIEKAHEYPKAARLLLRLLLEQTSEIGYNAIMAVEIEVKVLDHGYQIVAQGTACLCARDIHHAQSLTRGP